MSQHLICNLEQAANHPFFCATLSSFCSALRSFEVLLEGATDANIGLVILGGLGGGLLQPVYSRITEKQVKFTSNSFLWSALLGVAAAGISVYVVANSYTGNPARLLFFSVLCGLAFPAILRSAVDGLTRQTQEVQREVAGAAQQARSNDAGNTALAADQLKNTLASNPKGGIEAKGASLVEATAQIAVQNIAETASVKPQDAARIVNQLQQVGTIAKTAGYDQTAKAAAQELVKLSSAPIDETIQAVARDAAQVLSTS